MHLGILALLCVAGLGSPLFSTTQVLSAPSTDVASQFLYARAFGFGELARGNLALWNPYLYGGVPHLGDFQSALLYPPNLIFLFFPLATAINWSFCLHIFLLGSGIYLWAVQRGLMPTAGLIAGTAAMLNGTVFFHIYAGHLTMIAAMPWTPFIFLGIDGWLARRHAAWIFLASAAAALQIYSGQPQYVYYTALIAGAYALVHLVGQRGWKTAVPGLLSIYPLAVLLSAAQLIPGIRAASESVRGGGVDYSFSAMFSFPPENLLTLLAPWFFGGSSSTPYWGRCYLWEMCAYMGIGTLMLAVYGARAPQMRVSARRLLILTALTLLLLLGAHTPLHKLLYHILPGFSSFRGPSKFIFFSALFLSLLAGIGVDRLLRGDRPSWKFLLPALATGTALLLAGFWLRRPEAVTLFERLLSFVISSRESYLNSAAIQMPAFLKSIQATATDSLLTGGVLLLFFFAAFSSVRRWKQGVWLLIAAVVVELFLFARQTNATFPLKDMTYPALADFFKKNPGDYRVLNLINADSTMLLRQEGIWGFDPLVLKRYARLMFLSQGQNPDQAGQYLSFQSSSPLLSLFRCRLALIPQQDGSVKMADFGEVPARFFVTSKYRVISEDKTALETLGNPAFNPLTEVVLETPPVPAPEDKPSQATIRVLDSSTDHWTVDVTTDHSTLLVMTDSYSKDWKATALPGGIQQTYEILPANYAVRAIPLTAGHHILRIEYRPAGFSLGVFLTLASLVALTTSLMWPPLRERLQFAA